MPTSHRHLRISIYNNLTENSTKKYLSETGRVVKKYLNTIPGIRQYVIMPNHIHMIIEIKNNKGNIGQSRDDVDIDPYQVVKKEQSIPQRIKSFKILITKELRYSIFQRSYHDHIIHNEKEYWQILKYIKENPVKWEDDCYL